MVIIILPDIRSTYNTGSFFRTADGAGVEKIYLTGITAPPPHPHLIKVSLGAEDSVPWEQKEDVNALIQDLKKDNWQIVAVEQTKDSVDYKDIEYSDKVALLFGNEVEGLVQEILDQADLIVDLPMRGEKESLNVSIAGGIMIYHLLS